ncbi:hypothetical protein WN55_00919 [Dufourea novaeangliae]|uniref:Uncharacterized protein n=1 Tax=Dufourea novaeangliae TaxID=178035 RepID=A0A154PBH0_DUFNO|nr:hypothetical protein WN55_00919 [Dufourea novaeangliae]
MTGPINAGAADCFDLAHGKSMIHTGWWTSGIYLELTAGCSREERRSSRQHVPIGGIIIPLPFRRIHSTTGKIH